MSETPTERTLRLVREEWTAPIEAERDAAQADLTSLRAAVTDQVTDIRKWAEGDRAVQAHLENLGKSDEAEAYDATSKSLDVVADRLQALLPDTSRDRGKGT